MTGKQSTVLWLGLALILVRLVTTGRWSDLWGIVSPDSNGAAITAAGSSALSTAGGLAAGYGSGAGYSQVGTLKPPPSLPPLPKVGAGNSGHSGSLAGLFPVVTPTSGK